MATRKRKPPSGIKIKKSKRGTLRSQTKKTKSGKIPVAELQRKKRSKDPKTRAKANFALNARKWGKGKRGGKK